MASIVIKTPTRSINLKASKKDQTLFLDEIEKNVSKMCIGRLSRNVEQAYEEQISIFATFFQRVIARTPVDETYEKVIVTKTGEQKIVKHTPDDEICREHWFIEEASSSTKIYSKEFFTNGGGFDVINNNEEITRIKNRLREVYPLSNFTDIPSFILGNDCKHFERLEFGYSGWSNDTDPTVGMPYGREHGVKNKHSVQAPVGMLRITQAELNAIRRKPSLRKLSGRYKGGGNVRTMPSDKKLKEFYELLKRSHRVRYADIKRYLEVY